MWVLFSCGLIDCLLTRKEEHRSRGRKKICLHPSPSSVQAAVRSTWRIPHVGIHVEVRLSHLLQLRPPSAPAPRYIQTALSLHRERWKPPRAALRSHVKLLQRRGPVSGLAKLPAPSELSARAASDSDVETPGLS